MKTIAFTRLLGIVLLAWFSMLGFDFFLHAGVLAPFYARPSPFLLPPDQAFALIPLGYLALLVSAVMLTWLVKKLGIETWREGFLFGLKFGALGEGALALSLLSITTVDPVLIAGWAFGQMLESAIAGLVVGAGFGTEKLGWVFIRVLLFVIGSLATGILLQNL